MAGTLRKLPSTGDWPGRRVTGPSGPPLLPVGPPPNGADQLSGQAVEGMSDESSGLYEFAVLGVEALATGKSDPRTFLQRGMALGLSAQVLRGAVERTRWRDTRSGRSGCGAAVGERCAEHSRAGHGFRRSVRPTARRSPTCRSGCRASAFRFDRPAKHLRREPEGHPALQERAVIDFPRRERLDQDGEFVGSACVHRSCLPLPVR